MKKILSLFLIAISILLVSCGKKDTVVATRKDNPTAESIESFKLESVKNGKTIKTVEEDKNYYVIKIAEDAKSTLFAHHTAIDNLIEEHKTLFKTVKISPLSFTNTFNSYEVNEIMAEVFDSKTGITKELLGVDFDLKANKKWVIEIKCNDVVDAYLNDNQKNNYVSKVYLPMYVEHYENNEPTLKAYVMVPVYYALTTINDDVNSDTVFNSIDSKELVFDEKTNLLK